MNLELIRRSAAALAPKLIAFLATGLTASGLIAAVQWVGALLNQQWTISAPLAALIVGGTASVAAYIQRDKLLDLAPGQLAYKVIVFVLTSVSAVTVVTVAAELGFDLSQWSPLIGVALTALATILGYVKKDATIVPLHIRSSDGTWEIDPTLLPDPSTSTRDEYQDARDALEGGNG